MNSGKVPVNVLKRSVLRQLKNKRSEIANSAGLGADCAIFEPFSEGQLVTCVQEGVVELCCENDLAEAEREDPSVMPMRRFFQKCANNLATAGAEPVAAELVIFLPESVEEPELKALMSEAEGIAAELNIQIIGGQTRVSSAVRQAPGHGDRIWHPQDWCGADGCAEEAGGTGYYHYEMDRPGRHCGSGGPEPGRTPDEIPGVSGGRSCGV